MIKGIVEEGLIYHLDGIQNRGSSKKHRNDAPTWVNLTNEEQYCDIKGNPQWDDKGLTFSGADTSEYVTLGEFNPETITIECIIRICDDSTEGTVVSNIYNGGYKLYVYNKSIFFGSFLENNPNFIYVSTERNLLGDLNFVSCTYDGFTFKIYINGELKSSYSFYQSPMSKPSDNTITIIGGIPKGQSSQSQPFNGEIHSVRMYKRALSEEEIKQNYEIDIQRYPRLEKTFTWTSSSTYYRNTVANQIISGDTSGGSWAPKTINNGQILIGMFGQSGYTPPLIMSPDINAIKFYYVRNGSNYGELNETIFSTIIHKGHIWYAVDPKTYYKHVYGYPWLGNATHNPLAYQSLMRYMINNANVIYTDKDDGSDDDEDIFADGRVKYVRVRAADGSYSNALAFLVSPENVDFQDGKDLNEHLEEKALASIYSDEGINLGRKTYQDEEEENIETGHRSSAIGQNVKASGQYSFATGEETEASGNYSRAGGSHTIASGDYSVAEGVYSEAEGIGSHAEGAYTKSTGDYSHSAGFQTESKGKYSTAIGMGTVAEGEGSFAIGVNTIAKGKASFAAGEGTIAAQPNQFVHGKYNIEDTEGKYIEIIGNGTDDANRSNAFVIGKNGDVYIDGKVEAAKFDGPAIYDTRMQEIQDYVYDLEPKDDKLMVYKGSGEEIELDLSKGAWENIQEKIGSWHSKNPINISKSWGRIVNFGYINRTKWHSACVFYAQLVLFANPPADASTFDVEFELRIDDVVVDETWRPKETLEKGYHVIHLMHPIRQIPPDKEVHMVTVWAKTTGGTISVDPGGAQAAFFGMGIDSGDVRWDGQIKCQDDFELQRYNITFEQDDKIHKGYTIQYKEKIKEFLRVHIVDNRSFKLHQKVYDKDASGKKTGWHYNITFAEDDYVFNMDNLTIGVHGLFSDSLRPNQDGLYLPDLTALNFRILGDYLPKYIYSAEYIITQTESDTSKLSSKNILLQQNYSNTSKAIELDEGKTIELNIDFTKFKEIDVAQIKEVL